MTRCGPTRNASGYPGTVDVRLLVLPDDLSVLSADGWSVPSPPLSRVSLLNADRIYELSFISFLRDGRDRLPVSRLGLHEHKSIPYHSDYCSDLPVRPHDRAVDPEGIDNNHYQSPGVVSRDGPGRSCSGFRYVTVRRALTLRFDGLLQNSTRYFYVLDSYFRSGHTNE